MTTTVETFAEYVDSLIAEHRVMNGLTMRGLAIVQNTLLENVPDVPANAHERGTIKRAKRIETLRGLAQNVESIHLRR